MFALFCLKDFFCYEILTAQAFSGVASAVCFQLKGRLKAVTFPIKTCYSFDSSYDCFYFMFKLIYKYISSSHGCF